MLKQGERNIENIVCFYDNSERRQHEAATSQRWPVKLALRARGGLVVSRLAREAATMLGPPRRHIIRVRGNT